MRQSRLIIILILISCQAKEETFLGGWTDKEYGFLESVSHDFSYSIHDDLDYLEKVREIREFGTEWGVNPTYKKFQWIRKPENILMFFQTAKAIGLEYFISKTEYNEILFDTTYSETEWKGKSLNDICRKLIDSYKDSEGSENYYSKFWARRKNESNNDAVYSVLKEIDLHYNGKNIETYDKSMVDSVLFNLLRLDVELKSADSSQKAKTVLKYFDYLRKVELNHSAYNLAFEISEFDDLKLNRDSLLLLLKPDTLSATDYWAVRNNAKWIKTYGDNGP